MRRTGTSISGGTPGGVSEGKAHTTKLESAHPTKDSMDDSQQSESALNYLLGGDATCVCCGERIWTARSRAVAGGRFICADLLACSARCAKKESVPPFLKVPEGM